MLCIDNLHTDIYFNLAAEEYLLKNSGKDIFMIWQSDPSAVAGKYQHIEDEINLGYAKRDSIKIARRITGGGTVFHDLGNLNITFIEQNSPGNSTQFTNRLLTVLQPLIPEIWADERNNLLIGGLKVSGSAQCMHQSKFMHHCTLLFSSDLQHLNTVLKTNTDNLEKRTIKTVQSIHSPVTNISDHLSEKLSLNEFRKYLFDSFLKLDPKNAVYSFNDAELSAINQLCKEKYISSGWIFKW